MQGDVDSRHGSFYAVQSQKKEACNMVRILVVEDDEKLNHVVCRYLGNSGFETVG